MDERSAAITLDGVQYELLLTTRATREIAKRYGMDPALAEQIARLYVTHPGVTVDGSMGKMGL